MVLTLRVESAGHAFVTDLGRPGHAVVGLAANGAADAFSARVAPALVGDVAAPLVEVTGSALVVVPDAPALLAVTGAADRVLLDGEPHPSHELLVVGSGVRCEVPAPTTGWRSYLAVNGTLEAPRLLGSVAPDALLGVGRPLRAGDVLRVDSRFTGLDHPALRLPVFRLGAPRVALGTPARVDVTAGPEAAEFAAGLDQTYTVSPASDAVGLRLTGAAPTRAVRHEILSRGVPVGAIEVPPGGGLLALLRGRLVTAGYPVVAVATTVGVDRLAQLRPGEEVRFREVDLPTALAALRARESARQELAVRVRRAFEAVGLAECLAVP